MLTRISNCLIVVVLASTLGGCIALEHMLDPRPVGALNLVFEEGPIWQQAESLDPNGTWRDSEGSELSVELTKGFGKAHVATEDAKFFWTHADMIVQGGSAKVDRRNGSDKVDSRRGTLTYEGTQGDGVLGIRFSEEDVWLREGAVPFGEKWYEGQTPIYFEPLGGGRFRVSAGGGLGWTHAEGWVRGATAEFTIHYVGGAKTFAGVVKVGLPRVEPELEQLVGSPQAQG